MREAFSFYKSYYDVLNELSDKDKLTFLMALLDRQFHGVEPNNLKGIAKLAYVSQKHSIDKQVKGWEDKTGKTLQKRTESTPTEGGSQGPTEGPCQQEKEKEQEKGKEQVQVQEKGGVILPFDSGDFKKVWENWIEYRFEIKKPYKSKKSEQAALLKLSRYEEKTAIEMIFQSIAGGWQGIFELKNQNNDDIQS